tara:strand:- start:2435 stop:2752 length:318 start_codon:yes stop_codon:yes gene_type:complete
MSIPVIPNHPTVQLKMSNLADSCNLNQTTNISLAGLSSGGGSMSFNSNTNVSTLPSGSITIPEGYLSAWLVANFGDEGFGLSISGNRMSEFPVGRSCQTAGYLGR